ncbi:hypothetical protein CRG98_035956 [Punica granatum]|uniref:Uncharacterized protein n=1 Tax=Punica granatum TaxID=22663 RepID=A0A2I0II21_PUNGR|nr:hypothetical protein CRG98_035956 [Punica granatum]
MPLPPTTALTVRHIPQDIPPPNTMDPLKTKTSRSSPTFRCPSMFSAQMSMAENAANEEADLNSIPLTLLVKPFCFKIPPSKLIIPQLIRDWNTKHGVSIVPNRYTDEIFVYPFRDQDDLPAVENGGACSVRGAQMRQAHWAEEIPFDTIDFWVQIRGISPKKTSKPG